MLYTPKNHFNWQVDNLAGVALTDATGTSLPGHANANQKGADTAILAGLAEDCYGISIGFSAGSTTSASRRHLVDLLIDPAAGVGGAGASWSVAIANLYSNSPQVGSGQTGVWFYFPLYLKAGTAFGGAHQENNATSPTVRIAVRLYGKPTRPDLLLCGTKVQTLGATTASTEGTAVTPGTSNTWGSYSASLGTLSLDSWWWQIGIGSTDTAMNAHTALYDAAVNATNKLTVAQEIPYTVAGTSEVASKGAFGRDLPIRNASAGENVYVRGNCLNSASDTGMSAIVYALS